MKLELGFRHGQAVRIRVFDVGRHKRGTWHRKAFRRKISGIR